MGDAYPCSLSYFTDLQGSQTYPNDNKLILRLVTLLIYKVLKPDVEWLRFKVRLVTLLIYKVLKRCSKDL